jgi:hypothetical protein
VTTRAIQWATGAVGATQLQEIIDDPALELVGLFVYSDDKAGVDAGLLVGREPVGVIATSDRDEILALDADVVIHAASKGHGVNTNLDDIVALLESGKDVITTTTYNHLPTYGAEAHERIVAAARRGGTRFHAAGEHPGFMFERLAATLTGLSKTIDSITVQEFADCSKVPTPEMLFDLMGMGKAPEDITPDTAMFKSVSIQYEQAMSSASASSASRPASPPPSWTTTSSCRSGRSRPDAWSGRCSRGPATTTAIPSWWPRSTGWSRRTSRSGSCRSTTRRSSA